MSSSALDPARFWNRFSADPRRPESAVLRASDRDRDVLNEALGEGYAEGRLDASEYDERSTSAAAVRILGEIPALVADLVPVSGVLPARLEGPDELQTKAVQAWEAQRRNAFMGMLFPTLITFAIYLASSLGSGGFRFPWPVIVLVVTGANLVRTQVNRQDIVDAEHKRLERKQRRRLESEQKRRDRGGDA